MGTGTIKKTLVVGEAGEGGGVALLMRSSLPIVIVPIVNVTWRKYNYLHTAAFDWATVIKKSNTVLYQTF